MDVAASTGIGRGANRDGGVRNGEARQGSNTRATSYVWNWLENIAGESANGDNQQVEADLFFVKCGGGVECGGDTASSAGSQRSLLRRHPGSISGEKILWLHDAGQRL